MVQEEKVDKQFIADLVGRTSFNETLLSKDYYITRILYALKDIKGIYFKGGTALQKIFLDHSRLSEDIDFTLQTDVKKKEEEITYRINSSSNLHALHISLADGSPHLIQILNGLLFL